MNPLDQQMRGSIVEEEEEEEEEEWVVGSGEALRRVTAAELVEAEGRIKSLELRVAGQLQCIKSLE
eukprot:scaffold14732_cov167-Ochromonas_danica.AAC.2